ncbi:10438_t:CDS:1, partial [Ambispora leptoticha]
AIVSTNNANNAVRAIVSTNNANNAVRAIVSTNNANNAVRVIVSTTTRSVDHTAENAFSFLPAHYAVSETNSLLQRVWISSEDNSNVPVQNETLVFTEGSVFKEPDYGVDCTFHHVGNVPDIRNNT